jgi:hypothetical protein
MKRRKVQRNGQNYIYEQNGPRDGQNYISREGPEKWTELHIMRWSREVDKKNISQQALVQRNGQCHISKGEMVRRNGQNNQDEKVNVNKKDHSNNYILNPRQKGETVNALRTQVSTEVRNRECMKNKGVKGKNI